MQKNALKKKIYLSIIVFITFILYYFHPLYNVDKMGADRLYNHSSITSTAIKIIKIDERSLEEYGQYNTWNRDIPAQLVEKLTENPEYAPAVIAFDILYISEMDKDGDERFANACERAGNVIVADNIVYNKAAKQDINGDYYVDEMNIQMIEKPYDKLWAVTEQGFANTTQDTDGYIRQALAYVDTEEGRIFSLSYQIYEKYMKYVGKEASMPRIYANNRFEFAFSGESGAYENISLVNVLDGTVDPRVFSGCVVLVGAYAPGMQDAYNVAAQRGAQMYGVEIHANILEALMKGKTAVPVNPVLCAVLMAAAAGLFYYLIQKINMMLSFLLLAVLLILNSLLGVMLYKNGYVMQLIGLPVILIISYVSHIASNYLVERKKRKEVVGAFKKYVAPQIVDEVSKSGEFKLVLGGECRDIAVLFVDIRGFTPMSESLQPEQVVEILNEYLTLTTRSIFKNGGTLDKFIGDATMAVFNAPFDLDDYVFKAVCTARDIASGADELEKKMMERFGKSVSFGIGVNCGSAVVGNIGCDFRMDYTAIGDTVNTAARLESNAKRRQILISEMVYEKVKDRVEVTSMGEIPLKGKSRSICVYSVDKVLES